MNNVGIIDRNATEVTVTNTTTLTDLRAGTLEQKTLREGTGIKSVFVGGFANTTGSTNTVRGML